MELKRKDFKRIHDIACGDWKPKLLEWYGSKFAIEDTIEIKDSEYKLMRASCTDEQLFDEIFGKDIRDKVKTVEDAIKLLGENDEEVKELKALESVGSKNVPFQSLVVVIKALNDGWYPDWNNIDEAKYYPYFRMKSMSLEGCNYHYGISNIATRLCLRSKKLAVYCETHFNSLYKEYMK